MTFTTTLSTLALALAVTLPAVRAECYENTKVWMFNENSSNFKFGHLHNDPGSYDSSDTKDVTQEVSDIIDALCKRLDGQHVGRAQHFEQCNEFGYETQEQSCQLIDCGNDCEGDTGCIQTCAKACPYVVKDVNHMIMEFKHNDDGDDTLTMTYDICSDALHGIFDDCSDYGGDTDRDGFFMRLDPNPWGCGDSNMKAANPKLIGGAGKGSGSSSSGGKGKKGGK